MNDFLIRLNDICRKPDAGKLILRLSLGGLLLFHGMHKVLHGIDGIQAMLSATGVPQFVSYGVIIGEVLAPILVILGIFTRFAALSILLTMVVAWLMVGVASTFTLDKVGAWGIESIAFYFLMSLVVIFLGAGKYAFGKGAFE